MKSQFVAISNVDPRSGVKSQVHIVPHYIVAMEVVFSDRTRIRMVDGIEYSAQSSIDEMLEKIEKAMILNK